MTHSLVIVESPAKCKKIEGFLGNGYRCLATYGHLRALKSLQDITFITNSEAPKLRFHPSDEKKRNITFLRNEIQKVQRANGTVYLATDKDREGEAIAWHVCDMFGLSIENTPRMIFTEITSNAVNKALETSKHMRLNMPLVHAQMARQTLDLLIGFKVSPILWKHIPSCPSNTDSNLSYETTNPYRKKSNDKKKNSYTGLSAGRCQTPTLKLVYDNNEDVRLSQQSSKFVYVTNGYFGKVNQRFRLNQTSDSENEIQKFLSLSVSHSHVLSKTTPKRVSYSPPMPYTTSKLQQAASNSLKLSPKDTMRLAQSLYEKGLITYMRTDSTQYAESFVQNAASFIETTWSREHLGNLTRITSKDGPLPKTAETLNIASTKSQRKNQKNKCDDNSSKTNLTQEAHEAIRPTKVDVEQLPVDSESTSKERRLYRMIWCNTIESCMAESTSDRMRVSLDAPALDSSFSTDKNTCQCQYVADVERVVFDGWKAVRPSALSESSACTFRENANDNNDDHMNDNINCIKDINDNECLVESSTNYAYFYNLKKGKVLPFSRIESVVQNQGTKLHYTEAYVVQMLERHGIGRPSTYASLIDKIVEKGYAQKGDIPGVHHTVREYRLDRHAKKPIIMEKSRMFGVEKGKMRIMPTGKRVYEYLYDDDSHFVELFSYDFTHKMERQLDEIEAGQVFWGKVCFDYCSKLDQICAIHSMQPISKDEKESMHMTVSDVDDAGESLQVKQDVKSPKQIRNIRHLTDSMSVRNGKWGRAYVFYQKSNAGMRKPTFLSISKFKEDVWTCDANVLVSWLRERYKMA